MDEKELQAIYCAWAEQKLGYSGASRVTFHLTSRGPYSEWTPDVDEYVCVEILVDGAWHRYETDLGELLPDLLRFSVAESAQRDSNPPFRLGKPTC